jgi:hypothetical protein
MWRRRGHLSRVGWRVVVRILLGAGLIAVATATPPPQGGNQASAHPVLRVEIGMHSAPVRRLAIDEARGIVVTASDDKTARVWDLRTGDALQTLRPAVGPADIGRLYGAALHPSRALVALAGTTGGQGLRHVVYLFDLDSRRLIRTIDAKGDDIKRLAWSPDGTVLVAAYAGDNGIRAFSTEGRLLFERPTAGPVYGLSIAAGGLGAATDLAGRVVVFRAQAERVQELQQIAVEAANPIGVAIAPDARSIVVGYQKPGVRPSIVDIASGRELRRLSPAASQEGHFGVVAWSPGGERIFVAGSASDGKRRYPVWSFDARDGEQIGVADVATDSVLDLAALADGRVAFSSFDGSWGVVGRTVEFRRAPPIGDLRGPSNFRASADARRISWTFSFGADPGSFDFDRRTVSMTELPGLKSAVLRRGLLDSPLVAGFETAQASSDLTEARLNGRTIHLAGVEKANCGTYLHTSTDAILGTSVALYRYGSGDAPLWRVATAAEVLAVIAGDQDRTLVTAMADGTIAWRRASDGAELLTLLARRDGRWVLWTPEGYFDASAGADELVGWVVNRLDGDGADFFALGRFRDRYHRPDVIDRVLETLDTRVAIESSPASMRAQQLAAAATVAAPAASLPTVPAKQPAHVPAPAIAATPQGSAKPQTAKPAPAPATEVAALGPAPTHVTGLPARPVAMATAAPPRPREDFPPIVAALGPTRIVSHGGAIEIPFVIRSSKPGDGSDVEIFVRVNGRPVDPGWLTLPSRLDGGARGSVALDLPPGKAMLQLVARTSSGTSEPLLYEVDVHEAVPVAVVAANPPHAGPSSDALVPPSRAAGAKPNLYILAVGISHYQRQDYRLDLPAKDAKDFAAAFAKQKGREYEEVVTRVLTDAQATRQAVLDGLSWLAGAVSRSDIGVLFLAGHGVTEYAGQYYFLPYEAQHEKLEATAVPEGRLRESLGRIRGRTLFFVDTCYAGNVVGDPRHSGVELSRLANELASGENGVVVFASSSGRQESEENLEWGTGAFTKAVIEGLQGGADLNHRGRVSFKGLDFFVSEEVRKLTGGRQTPVTITPRGVPDFDLAAMWLRAD